MNGELVQARIYAGYAKAAAKAGRPYDLYRAGTPISPLDGGNLIQSIDCLFAAEKRFEVPNKFKIPTRYLYADGRVLRQRDLLVGPYGTFFVADLQPNLPLQAVRCNEVVSVSRPVYQGAVIVPEQIVLDMPAFRQLKKVDQKPVSAIGGASTAATVIGEWFLFLPVEFGMVRQGDIITDQIGRTFSLDTIDNTEIGLVLTMRQSDAAT